MSVTLDLIFVALAAILVILGIFRGFIKSVIRSAKLILSFVLAYFLGSPFGMLLKDAFVGNWVYDGVSAKVNGVYNGVASNITADGLLSQFPDFIVSDELRATIANATSEETGEALVQSISKGIADPISTAVSNVLGYVLVFILAFIGLMIAAWFLTKIVEKFAFIGLANRILGGVWGALTALIAMIVISSVVKLFFGHTDFYTSSVLVKWIGDSEFFQAFGIFNLGNLIS